MTDKPNKGPQPPAFKLDLLQTLLQDTPRQEGVYITPARAAALAKAFRALAVAAKAIEELQMEIRLERAA